ncbi:MULTISPECIES: hypothetical protein [Pectobacterium]|nr:MULTISPECIES: hypothetical protein [Pectobacterium]
MTENAVVWRWPGDIYRRSADAEQGSKPAGTRAFCPAPPCGFEGS